jgi:hypothetical protein
MANFRILDASGDRLPFLTDHLIIHAIIESAANTFWIPPAIESFQADVENLADI